MKHYLIVLFWFILTVTDAQAQCTEQLIRANRKLTNAIMEDLFSPPVASRIYLYPNVAAYEILCLKNSSLNSLSAQIIHFKPIPKPENPSVNLSLSATFCFIYVAKKLIYSEYIMDSLLIEEEKLALNEGIQSKTIVESKNYAQQVAEHIFEWMHNDNYTYTRTLHRYILSDSLSAWRPTAPEYANALEPNWPLMRSLVSDVPNYCKAIPNVAYSEDKKSTYYKNALTLYQTSKKLDSAQIKTAFYWDDNPNTAQVNGHLTYYIHKICPPGHWMMITTQSILKRKMTEDDAAELMTMVAISMYEGFLSCWAEKFKSNAVRPETYIHKLIDPLWKPLIETPPFPEYTSGHSVVSAAAATMLTHYLPKPHAFYDSTHLYLNLAPRYYTNFFTAANEASISRFYGGIHYMPSLTNGNKQGRDVSNYILAKLRTRKQP